MAISLQVLNGDILISSASGRPITVTGPTKLSQELSEFFQVNIMPNGFGSGLEQLVGLVPYAGDVIVGITDRQIRSGIDTFIQLQSSDGIARSPSEIVTGVTQIIVQQDTQDPTKYLYFVNITTAANQSVPFTGQIGI